MELKWPETKLDDNVIELKRIHKSSGFSLYRIKGHEQYSIRYDSNTNKAILIGPSSIYPAVVVRGLNIEEEMEFLPGPIRDFIVFNLDIFS